MRKHIKTILLTIPVWLLLCLNSEASATTAHVLDEMTGNACNLLTPGEHDLNGRWCTDGWSITQNGYMVDLECFTEATDALAYATQPICQFEGPISIGACAVLYPGQADKNGRFCTDGYGVVFKDFMIHLECYPKLQSAYEKMTAEILCRPKP